MFRPTARALITDPDDRILLLRVRDAVPLNASDPVTNYWITVGGGVEPGETFETAIVREIFEETGHVIEDPGPCIWRRRKSITDAAGVTRATDERYFWCPVSLCRADPRQPDPVRAQLHPGVPLVVHRRSRPAEDPDLSRRLHRCGGQCTAPRPPGGSTMAAMTLSSSVPSVVSRY